ncbi:MAG TPA: hypothetical protein PKD70_06140 [Saprospiraceae bacterium]|nr:hypothetical protein [Saprospiraceae bacterium]HMP13437.1 hypothetical protein [Saprospiraceae bacterium]
MANTTNPVFPFGAASKKTLASAVTLAAGINNTVTIIEVALEIAATLNLTVDSETRVGSLLFVKVGSDGTARNLTPGTGMTGTAVAGTINKTKVATYVYDGSTFVHTGTQQID